MNMSNRGATNLVETILVIPIVKMKFGVYVYQIGGAIAPPKPEAKSIEVCVDWRVKNTISSID